MTAPFSYLTSAELTDVGHRRKNNEDALARLPEEGVFCVADGMGGVQGGAVASQAAVDALREAFTDSPDAPFALTAKASARLIARALNTASQWIKDRADERGLTGSGSTAVVLAFDRIIPTRALVLHAGDSRAYRYREDTLVQLSADHSVAAAAGLADERDLPAMFRGVITRAVGLEPTVELEETAVDVQPNDLFLLCSDGLSKMVSDRLIQKLLQKHASDPLDALARLLVDEALQAGGEDNVSVLLVRTSAVLPEAPTQEIPPETLALEAATDQPERNSPSSGLRPRVSEEAPTSETGQTPPTPPSSLGHTPVTTTNRSSAVRRPPSTGLLILIAFLLTTVVAGLLFLAWPRLRKPEGPSLPENGQPSAAAPEPRTVNPEH